MTDATLTARLKSLETQVAVLKAQMSEEPITSARKSLGDLYGVLKGKAGSDESDIDSVEYQFTWDGKVER